MNTTSREDTILANAIFELCKKSNKVNDLSLPLQLKQYGHLLDGQPLENDPQTFEQKVRTRNFSQYCRDVIFFLKKMKLFHYVPEVINNGIYPQEIHYLRLTKLGAIFSGLSFPIQRFLLYVLERAYWLSLLVKKYKWVGTIASTVVAIVSWLKVHDISGYLILVSVVAGVISMFVANWLHGETSHEVNDEPPDDSIA